MRRHHLASPAPANASTSVDGIFSRSQVQMMFDVQLERMYKLIDWQLNRMRAVAPHDHVVSVRFLKSLTISY